jgi:hypothetical protein
MRRFEDDSEQNHGLNRPESVRVVRYCGRVSLEVEDGSGTAKEFRTFRFAPADVKAIRNKLGASQAVFTQIISVRDATLRNRAPGRRSPEGPASLRPNRRG